MASYLLIWNPDRFSWGNYADVVARTRRGEMIDERWSTGNRRILASGSRLYLLRSSRDRGIVASGTATSDGYVDEHWDREADGDANFVNAMWDTVLDVGDELPIESLVLADLGIPWNRLQASGVEVPEDAEVALKRLWQNHLESLGRDRLFRVGTNYTRRNIYDLLHIPAENQGGDWDTGSHRHGEDWFIFASVGTTGRTGHDYNNYWDGDELVWRGRNGSRLNQPKTQSMLNPTGKVHIFTRERDRDPFTYEGSASAIEARDDDQGGPVIIRWQFPDPLDRRPEVLPNELPSTQTYREGTVRTIRVNAYERNPKARRKCIEHHGTMCAICGFVFGDFYGEEATGFIHVHHLKDLALIGEQYDVDPINDLRPVCPNCHAMLHWIPGMTMERLKELVQEQNEN